MPQPFEKIITDKNNEESIFELDYNVTDGNALSGYFYPAYDGRFIGLAQLDEFVSIIEGSCESRKSFSSFRRIKWSPRYGNRYRKANGGNNDDNYAVLRLAEMYLIRAEARANLG